MKEQNKRTQAEHKERGKTSYGRSVLSTLAMLIAAAVIAVTVATQWMPVLQIYGSSMNPTLCDGEIIVCFKTQQAERGDVIAFYHENKILVKRVIGTAGDAVHLGDDGLVSVNNRLLDEPYVTELDDGGSDIVYPMTVPEGSCFVMGDNRTDSVDSRSSAVGCVDAEQIIGKAVLRVWPLGQLGLIR